MGRTLSAIIGLARFALPSSYTHTGPSSTYDRQTNEENTHQPPYCPHTMRPSGTHSWPVGDPSVALEDLSPGEGWGWTGSTRLGQTHRSKGAGHALPSFSPIDLTVQGDRRPITYTMDELLFLNRQRYPSEPREDSPEETVACGECDELVPPPPPCPAPPKAHAQTVYGAEWVQKAGAKVPAKRHAPTVPQPNRDPPLHAQCFPSSCVFTPDPVLSLPLSQDQDLAAYQRYLAEEESGCFNCCGDHLARDCPNRYHVRRGETDHTARSSGLGVTVPIPWAWQAGDALSGTGVFQELKATNVGEKNPLVLAGWVTCAPCLWGAPPPPLPLHLGDHQIESDLFWPKSFPLGTCGTR